MVRKIRLKNLNQECIQAAETNPKTKLSYGSERMTYAEMKPRSQTCEDAENSSGSRVYDT